MAHALKSRAARSDLGGESRKGEGESVSERGLTVDWHTGDKLADAWVCWDDTGIWLSSWGHVATVHGMDDDMAFCDTVVNALKATYRDQRYACRMLNQ